MSASGTLRPFHETIVDAILRCPSIISFSEIFHLFTLIEETKITEGHDAIIAAIDEYFNFPRAEKYARTLGKVKESILAQKEAMSQRKSEKAGVSLDELQQETEKLLALLQDRQTGHLAWHEFMRERLQSMHRIISGALRT